jgi:hypothetical protein
MRTPFGVSASCQKATYAAQQNLLSFDHLVSDPAFGRTRALRTLAPPGAMAALAEDTDDDYEREHMLAVRLNRRRLGQMDLFHARWIGL